MCLGSFRVSFQRLRLVTSMNPVNASACCKVASFFPLASLLLIPQLPPRIAFSRRRCGSSPNVSYLLPRGPGPQLVVVIFFVCVKVINAPPHVRRFPLSSIRAINRFGPEIFTCPSPFAFVRITLLSCIKMKKMHFHPFPVVYAQASFI
jgi:hypothetical protein